MNNIALIRKSKGWTQKDLASVIHMDQSMISKIERGFDGVTLRTLKEISKALDVPLYQLFTEDAEAAEIILIQAYRSLSPDRRRGWEDMARAATVEAPTTDQ